MNPDNLNPPETYWCDCFKCGELIPDTMFHPRFPDREHICDDCVYLGLEDEE